MPTKNIFQRTAIFIKEPRNDGTIAIKRVPWDLIACENDGGFFASPTPVTLEPLADVDTDTTFFNFSDLINEEGQILNDEINSILWFESESEFMAKFEGAFGYYKTDPDAEYGFPRS